MSVFYRAQSFLIFALKSTAVVSVLVIALQYSVYAPEHDNPLNPGLKGRLIENWPWGLQYLLPPVLIPAGLFYWVPLRLLSRRLLIGFLSFAALIPISLIIFALNPPASLCENDPNPYCFLAFDPEVISMKIGFLTLAFGLYIVVVLIEYFIIKRDRQMYAHQLQL